MIPTFPDDGDPDGTSKSTNRNAAVTPTQAHPLTTDAIAHAGGRRVCGDGFDEGVTSIVVVFAVFARSWNTSRYGRPSDIGY